MVIDLKLRYKIILFVLGIYMASLGLFFLTVYSSLLNIGYSFKEFLVYISKRMEVYMLPIGFVLALLGMFIKKKDYC